MSKYQPRIFLNNPEKYVPDNIVEQFFLTIKTGDIDKIRDFVMEHKNKYNLIEKSGKGSPADSGKTPFHIVLELDDKIADNETKLQIMKFLDQMGAPIDLPDSADVWPIHLAASTQSKKIVDFLINKKVQLTKKDSSNNTPLHYAISGRGVECPKPVSIGSIVPSQKIENIQLNETLENANKQLIKLISGSDTINDNLVHIINTIMKLPEMYAEDKFAKNLETEVIGIFTDVALDPTYSANLVGDPRAGALTVQQNKLEQLIERTFTTINDEWRGLTNPLSIAPNKAGWGPKIPLPGGGTREPNNLERILDNERINLKREIDSEYATTRNKLISTNTITTAPTLNIVLPRMLATTDTNYINKLIFCPDCPEMAFGEEVGLTKMLFLLIWNHYLVTLGNLNYPEDLANRIFAKFRLMNKMFVDQNILRKYTQKNLNKSFGKNERGYLYRSDINSIVNNFGSDRKFLDDAFATASNLLGQSDCISNKLIPLFLNSDDPIKDFKPVNLFTSQLYVSKMNTYINAGNPVYQQSDNYYNNDPARQAYFNIINKSWYELLESEIKRIKPLTTTGANIFILPTVLQGIALPPNPNYYLPRVPLPRETPPLGNSNYNYTYQEAFRIMQMIETFLLTRDYQIGQFPKIFDAPLNQWNDYIDQIAAVNVYNPALGTIDQYASGFILLYKILAEKLQEDIKKIITDCVDEVITNLRGAKEKLDDPNAETFRKYVQLVDYIEEEDIDPDDFSVFDDASAFNLLFPSYPTPSLFATNPAKEDPFKFYRNEWNATHPLVKWFEYFLLDIDKPDIINEIGEIIFANPDVLGDDNMHLLRDLIEKSVSDNQNIIDTILEYTAPRSGKKGDFFGGKKEFRLVIRKYFGTYVETNPKRPIPSIVTNQNFLTSLSNFTDFPNDVINLIDAYAVNLQSKKLGQITDIFFLTETYGYFFVKIKRMLNQLTDQLESLNKIAANIITFINTTSIYYVPQIFLPAMIKQIIVIVDFLFKIRDELSTFNLQKAEFMGSIDSTNKKNTPIIKLGDEFIDYIKKELATIYANVVDVVKYHNSVVEFLNYHSSYRLASKSSTNAGGISTSKQLFDANLIPIESFPNLFSDAKNFEVLAPIMRAYRIPRINYYAGGNEIDMTDFDSFNIEGEAHGPYQFTNYLGIINYERDGELSNSPLAGDNSQLNITAVDNAGDTDYTINDIPVAIQGEWLNISLAPKKISYLNAFISYNQSTYQYQWLSGMPPSIKSLADSHFKIMKQRIIEETIQEVIDQHSAGGNTDIELMYESLRKVGTDEYMMLDDVKVYVVVGKLVDSLLNKLFEYTIRQSITSWIYNLATLDPRFKGLTQVKGIVDIIRKRDYSKISMNEISKSSVESLLKINPRLLDYQITQIEADPSKLEYTTPAIDNSLIHYLYDINYYSSGNINSNKKCYQINPEIAGKLITSDTLNAKNSDGNTPLHMAVTINHPELIELLIKRGATPKGFTNNHNQTPYAIGIENAKQHIYYTVGEKVFDTINNFAVPFNDLMTARLRDEKYSNNIIKNVTLGIPIQLCIYNHMFHVYLENYRYDFTFELKNDIHKLMEKYEGYKSISVYPIDLFEINDQSKLSKMLEPVDSSNRIITEVNRSNRNKIIKIEKQLDQLRTQLNGIDKEILITTNSSKRTFLDQLRLSISQQFDDLSAKLTGVKDENNLKNDPVAEMYYIGTVDSIKNRAINRNFGVIDYYNFAFDRVGNSNDLFINIWKNYLDKQLTDCPSMIFPIMNNMIKAIIRFSTTDSMTTEFKEDFNIMVKFFEIVKNYIETKNSLPQNLEDNIILREEFDQIIYLINLIITPAIRNILLNNIYKGLQEMDGAETIIRNQQEILDEILNTKFNGETLDTFLENVLPKLSIKYYSTIFDNSRDNDKKITNINDLYLPIIQIVKANKIIQVTDESLLVQNLREYLIPFIGNTYQNFIHHIRLAIYGYERYLLNTYQISKVLQNLI